MSELARPLTQLLIRYSDGDPAALEALLPEVYGELRRLASGYMKRERTGTTLQATALVHEAYLRLIDQKEVRWQNRAHFFGVAAQMMRRILVDHARRKFAQKRGGSAVAIPFDESVHLPQSEQEGPDLVSLDRALCELAEIDPRQSRIVELRYFGGLTVDETAEVMKLSPASVKRDWTLAKAWLLRALSALSA